MKGLLVWIYRDDGRDYTHGPSAGKTKAILSGPGLPELFEPTDDAPEFRVVTNDYPWGPYTHVEPVKPGQYMFSGTFVYTCDSRFPAEYPIPIHDRTEG